MQKAPLYLLGVNPGGDPVIVSEETIDSHTNRVLNDFPEDWSAYRDESWAGAVPGTRGMQPRVLHLLKTLKLSPGEVPSSNIVFVRSRREDQLKGDMAALAETCWPFHGRVIDQLRPKVVLCFGKTSGRFVCKKLEASKQIDQFVETNNRRWRSRTFASARGKIVIVATHPSIANWTASDTDPSDLVRRALLK